MATDIKKQKIQLQSKDGLTYLYPNIADESVTLEKLSSDVKETFVDKDSLVNTDNISDSAVTTEKLANANVTTDKLADSSVTIDKLSSEIRTALNGNVSLLYDSIPSTESIYNPIYRVNSEWFDNGFQNQGTIDKVLKSNYSKIGGGGKVEEGVGVEILSAGEYSYAPIISNLLITITADNYKPQMTYLNYCKMGSMPDDDVELFVSTSMQDSNDNRYHALVWEKTNLARVDWLIEGEWSGTYYKDTDGNNVTLSEADLNNAFLVTADCTNLEFALYSFNGKEVTKRGTAALPDTYEWQDDYVSNSLKRRTMGIGMAIYGKDHKSAIFYEGIIWDKVLTEDEIKVVFEQLKYYSD